MTRLNRALTGPRSVYRHKVRAPLSVLLTQEGHELLASELRRTGMRRNDYWEYLLREYGHRVPPINLQEVAVPA